MFKMIVAYCRQGQGIGKNGVLPWKLRADMKHFKKETIGKGNNAIIMGKNTWLGISKRPLPQRDNLILSKTLSGDNIFSSIPKVKEYCREKKFDEVWVIGGEEIYKQFIQNPDLQTIAVTSIHNKYDCDTFFPVVPPWFSLFWMSDIKCSKENISFQYLLYNRGQREHMDNVSSHPPPQPKFVSDVQVMQHISSSSYSYSPK